jgi:AcrR family transcriptional regulator
MRADARDNRSRILAAADEVFDRAGPAASTDQVAKSAGVGIATVFRHFPTKPDLLGAVFTTRLERLRDRARELAETEAGPGFFTFFAEVVAGARSKLALAGALAETGDLPETAQAVGEQMRESFGALVRRAQDDGMIRRDVDPTVAYALMVGASRATAYAGLDDMVRDGMLAVIFDGLRVEPVG